ncbi:MarR family transcriptional regulator [Hymenobacter sp. BT770]|uniref:MarR family winged helix-turn-helix transcriptional regulator n=1 Tax=Hymenobacter sp. BT770 TaxID=2886942 RepID=UPI001D119BBB|nr:MarR family transcriptional regulator [Hymenobacter sp. BT770]MCC3153969.1 MarR family transcriptional regulator [Hymenobacter sp. BT770]MDO3416101.1 MarR family transcriptional regulator [Hymenobacter sp. BT770]
MATPKPESPYKGCLFFSANALARLLTGLAEEAFRPIGLGPSHAFLLLTVNRQPGIQPKDIAAIMELTASTVTRLVEKMEQQGYLRREATGRTTQVQPTDKSLALQPQLQAAWTTMFGKYSQLIGVEEARRLTQDSYRAARALME